MKMRGFRSFFSRGGFTLIELLIVVAIIAILAAIAVPNFLEAQVRAKVSRVKSDMRTLATAMESYMVDYNTYPESQDNRPNVVGERGWWYLTTPISYISSYFNDPFSAMPKMNSSGTNPTSDFAIVYMMGSGVDQTPKTQCYCIISFGPNREKESKALGRFPYKTSTVVQLFSYDSTNGTKSLGDIYRFGGNYLTGDYHFDGVPWQENPPPMVVPQ